MTLELSKIVCKFLIKFHDKKNVYFVVVILFFCLLGFLFSDDDLEPYQMEEETEEKVLNGVRPPVYLSECISGEVNDFADENL